MAKFKCYHTIKCEPSGFPEVENGWTCYNIVWRYATWHLATNCFLVFFMSQVLVSYCFYIKVLRCCIVEHESVNNTVYFYHKCTGYFTSIIYSFLPWLSVH